MSFAWHPFSYLYRLYILALHFGHLPGSYYLLEISRLCFAILHVSNFDVIVQCGARPLRGSIRAF